MLKKILIGVAALVVVLIVVISLQPATFKVERSATISAPAAVVFPFVNDLHRWPDWSPWEKMDPDMKRTHSGAASGVGAVYEWQGNDQVGEGRMTIEESRPNQYVGIKLEFIEPFAATNKVGFALAPADKGTTVTWTMDGHNDFMGKAMCLVMDMDAMVGGDFEKGLAALKTLAEAEAAKQPPSDDEPAVVPAQPAAP